MTSAPESEQEQKPHPQKAYKIPPPILHDETKDTITAHLESITTLFIDGVNARDMLLNNEVFGRFMHPEFTAVPGPPGPQISLTLPEYLAEIQAAGKKHANGNMKILDLDTTIGLRSGSEAEVYFNYEMSGIPAGVTRTGVGLFRFRREQMSDAEGGGGKWRCFNFQSAAGLSGGGGGF